MHRWVRPLLLHGWAQKIPKFNGWISRKVPKTTAKPLKSLSPTKRIPSANYSLSIAVQGDALRVMCLTRGTLRSASGEPELLQRRPAHQPW